MEIGAQDERKRWLSRVEQFKRIIISFNEKQKKIHGKKANKMRIFILFYFILFFPLYYFLSRAT